MFQDQEEPWDITPFDSPDMLLKDSKAPCMAPVDSKAQDVGPDSETPNMAPVDFKPSGKVPVDFKAPDMAPVDSEAEMYCTDSKILAQLRDVSVVLVDCCKTQASQGTDKEYNRDGEQSKNSKRPKHAKTTVHAHLAFCLSLHLMLSKDTDMVQFNSIIFVQCLLQ